jgi:hypothetical protein
MKETPWWRNHLSKALHQPHRGRMCFKVQDAFRQGVPDLDGCNRGFAFKLELKYLDTGKEVLSPDVLVSPGLRPAQERYLELYAGKCGGPVWTLWGVGREWLLLPWSWPYNEKAALRDYRSAAVLCGQWGALGDLDPLVDFLSPEAHQRTAWAR